MATYFKNISTLLTICLVISTVTAMTENSRLLEDPPATSASTTETDTTEDPPKILEVVPIPDADIPGCNEFSGSTCTKCYIGYFLNGQKCERCEPGCEVCESKEKCSKVAMGYKIIDGKSVICPEGCKLCDDKSFCTQCLLGTYKYSKTVALRESLEAEKPKTADHAAETDTDEKGDKAIDFGRIEKKTFHEGECVKCPQFCKRCNSVRCLECIDNQAYKLSTSGRQCIDLQLKKFKFLALFAWLLLSSLLVVTCCCCCSCFCCDFWITKNCALSILGCFKGDGKAKDD